MMIPIPIPMNKKEHRMSWIEKAYGKMLKRVPGLGPDSFGDPSGNLNELGRCAAISEDVLLNIYLLQN